MIVHLRVSSTYGGNWNGVPQSNLKNGQAYLPFQRVPHGPCDPDVPSNNTICYARETSKERLGATLWKDLLGDCGGNEKKLNNIIWIKDGKKQIVFFNGEKKSDRETRDTNTNSSLDFYECGRGTSSFIDLIFVERYKPFEISLSNYLEVKKLTINHSFIVTQSLNYSNTLLSIGDIPLFLISPNDDLFIKVLYDYRKFPDREFLIISTYDDVKKLIQFLGLSKKLYVINDKELSLIHI